MDQRPYWYPGISLGECFQANIRFVNTIITGLFTSCPSPASFTREDAIQEAFIGFEHAFNLYDEQLGVKFCTYSFYWIRSEIQKAWRKYRELPANWLVHGDRRAIVSLDHLMAQKPDDSRHVPSFQPEDKKSDHAESIANRDLLEYAMRAVPISHRNIVELCVGHDVLDKEASEIFHKSKQRINQICQEALYRCRVKLNLKGFRDPNYKKKKYGLYQRIHRWLKRGKSIKATSQALKVSRDLVRSIKGKMVNKEVQNG